MKLNIINSDMKSIPYNDDSFSFVYSYNTSVHIPKKEFAKAVDNFRRVLRKNVLLFLNFISNECDTFGDGIEISDGEFLDKDSGALYVHYCKSEITELLEEFEVLYFEERKQVKN